MEGPDNERAAKFPHSNSANPAKEKRRDVHLRILKQFFGWQYLFYHGSFIGMENGMALFAGVQEMYVYGQPR
ncbi:hypothetical protein F383_23576 [Gossypium arboreum]|uniref:Uncharacterized protein n=1 Tax=Gossypium arboreum TaxID=29729 RepID=A0A0B0NTF9_GOSAR|nr:hypothetical protein F383_23576 [Gossypium arboreum]